MGTMVPRFDKLRLLETVQGPATAGPTRTSLPITEVIKRLVLRISCALTETGTGANGVTTTEGILGLLRTVTVEGSSSSRSSIGKIKSSDLGALYWLNTFLHGVPGLITGQTAALAKSAAASPWSVNIPIDFEMLFSQDPRQTLLNTTELTSLFLNLDWGEKGDIIDSAGAGYATTTLTVPKVEIYAEEFIDANSKAASYGVNRFSFIEQTTTSTNARLAIDLKRGYMIRGILIKQFTQSAYPHVPVETVVNNISLELNREVKKSVSWNVLKAHNADLYQLRSADLPTGYAFLDLMPEGRYDTIVDTRIYRDVNLILDVTGQANSKVRVYPVEIIPSQL